MLITVLSGMNNNYTIKKPWTTGDVILIIVLILLSSGSFWVRDACLQTGNTAIVEINGTIVKKVPLDHDGTYAFQGLLGETTISIHRHEVSIISSPCPRHYCMESGTIRRPGDILVCVPNRISVRITAESQSGFDIITE
ncbi:NusG domain II-containing protein [candidate division KSB1 bacterium]|nr:NusG domain II-containing protein [candidate division KSB1 bacterium]